MSETPEAPKNGWFIKFTAEGLVIRWQWAIPLVLGMLLASSGTTRLTSLIFPDKSESERQSIKTNVQSLTEKLDEVTRRLEACEAVNNYIMKQNGLDKLSKIFPDTTKKVAKE